MNKRLHILCLFMGILLNAHQILAQAENKFGQPNPLTGKAGTAGPASVDALSLNPALAGELEESEAQVRWGYQQVSYTQRYPGFDAYSSNKGGLDPTFPIPSLAYKATRRLGIGGLIIPFPVKQDIDVEKIPMVILGQENYVDIKGEGQLNAIVDLTMGYMFNPLFTLGLNFYYLSIKGAGDLLPSEDGGDGGEIASFAVASTTMAVGLGLKFRFEKLSVGVSTRIFEQLTTETSFESIASFSEDQEEGDDSGASTVGTIFNPIRLGISGLLYPGGRVMADVEYTRARQGQKRFSIVDFKEKEVDAYDTVAVYLGGIFAGTSQIDYLVGGFYEPSAIGPGGQGPEEKTGFGFFDLALNLGEPPDAPMWAAGAGMRYEFEKVSNARRKKPTTYKMAVEGGLVYAETSIGVDEDGEQPGAYLARRYKIPLKFIYRF